jgi:hypothetical protein
MAGESEGLTVGESPGPTLETRMDCFQSAFFPLVDCQFLDIFALCRVGAFDPP